MTYILKKSEWKFQQESGKIPGYNLFTESFKTRLGLKPENLHVDLRRLEPGQFSAPYHFHRNAEEFFMILSGSMTLRSEQGFQKLQVGDLAFFEKGKNGAHQFYNSNDEPCIYLDIRTFMGFDICEFPDSGKVLLAPSMEIFQKDQVYPYFEGEFNPREFWKEEINPERSQNT
ncbi:cupin domain-containing protein [Algoriphagus hitonicola]|uniref:Uncharacterized conserved protein, cupin superfamily n=1 Tax=Algoriphagus hitonicola TaxID=435880 RepID=A0A1I2QCP2_9BACT|nr:cupin domain-containing protein [Algoriphagus hitonicola]SFG23391.1 Uncharacterized conserved protein, cupin superfamily [Algoriphagus hitonicola]